MRRLAMAGIMVLALGACGRQDSPPASGPGQERAVAPATAPAPPEVVELADVMERDPRYLVGISYPPVAREHPGLARLLKDYADAARAELMAAVGGLGDEKPVAPYDLSLAFSVLLDTPELVTVAADGSSYTGGAHGNPLVARFTWLPQAGEQLTAARLVPSADGWALVSREVREQLSTALSGRLDDGDYQAGERSQLLEGGLQMIEQGTAPDPANFDQFEPVLDDAGQISAIRFVFPPYQVGPYAEGVQTATIPAAKLLPVIAPRYRPLFQGS